MTNVRNSVCVSESRGGLNVSYSSPKLFCASSGMGNQVFQIYHQAYSCILARSFLVNIDRLWESVDVAISVVA